MKPQALNWTRDHIGIIGLVFVLAVMGVIALVLIADNAAKEARRSGQQAAEETNSIQLRQACPVSQVTRAWQRVRAQAAEPLTGDDTLVPTADHYFRIVDCDATYAPGYRGRRVYLRSDLDDCFVELTKRGYWRDLDVPSSPRVPTTDPVRLAHICGVNAIP